MVLMFALQWVAHKVNNFGSFIRYNLKKLSQRNPPSGGFVAYAGWAYAAQPAVSAADGMQCATQKAIMGANH